jgi:hypothetical protein
VLHEHVIDRVEQRLLVGGGERHPVADPLVQIRTRFGGGICVGLYGFAHAHEFGSRHHGQARELQTMYREFAVELLLPDLDFGPRCVNQGQRMEK